jgi:hypothetical protein
MRAAQRSGLRSIPRDAWYERAAVGKSMGCTMSVSASSMKATHAAAQDAKRRDRSCNAQATKTGQQSSRAIVAS